MPIAYVLCLYLYNSYEIIAELQNPSDQMNDTLWKKKKIATTTTTTTHRKLKRKDKIALCTRHCTALIGEWKWHVIRIQ